MFVEEICMLRQIRKASLEDLPAIMTVIEAAKGIMRRSGNRGQWKDGYPSAAVIASDIDREVGFVVADEDAVVGYFAFIPAPEPTYAHIYQGQWLDASAPYHVIHRIASTPDSKGVFHSLMDWCFTQERNIRIDTHRDNHIMQHCIGSYGFTYCGIIYLASGDERLAYQRIRDHSQA